jgi:hypothetical protein
MAVLTCRYRFALDSLLTGTNTGRMRAKLGSGIEPMTTVFISYARGDDAAFAQRLHADLTQAGVAVWWDRESLHSVALTFHQQIKDAIHQQIDRLIYIAGPKAVIS